MSGTLFEPPTHNNRDNTRNYSMHIHKTSTVIRAPPYVGM